MLRSQSPARGDRRARQWSGPYEQSGCARDEPLFPDWGAQQGWSGGEEHILRGASLWRVKSGYNFWCEVSMLVIESLSGGRSYTLSPRLVWKPGPVVCFLHLMKLTAKAKAIVRACWELRACKPHGLRNIFFSLIEGRVAFILWTLRHISILVRYWSLHR